MTIDPAWQGDVQFYELVFGTWLAYIFLTVVFEKALHEPLAEWRYILINFFGAGAFWVNHYFQRADFYSTLLNLYTFAFLAAWYVIFVRPTQRPRAWKVGVTFIAVPYTVMFILFENIARWGVRAGYPEFYFMLVAFFGFTGLIIWRGKRNTQTRLSR